MPRTKTTRNPFGSIFPREKKINGRKVTFYDARKRYKDAEGNKKEKFKRCRSYAEAMTELQNFQNEITQKLKEAAEKKDKPAIHKVGDLIAYYRTEYVKPAVYNASGRKIAGFKRKLKNIFTSLDLLEKHFGALDVRAVTYDDLRKFKESYSQTLTERDKLPAQSTVNEKMSMLRRIFNVGIQIYWLDVSPFKRGDSLIDKASENKRNRMLTFEEEERLLKACEPGERTYPATRDITNKREFKRNFKTPEKEWTQTKFVDRSHLKPLIICALDTAMRRGEIFNLEWHQIDFEKRVIYLTQAAAQETKTGEEGILPLTDRLFLIFSEKYNGQPKSEKVFEKIDIKRSFVSACNEAGILDLQFRDLRSTGATRMVLAGNAESQVMKVTRHRNLKIFLDHYTNVDELNAIRIGKSLNKFIEDEKRKIENRKDLAA